MENTVSENIGSLITEVKERKIYMKRGERDEYFTGRAYNPVRLVSLHYG